MRVTILAIDNDKIIHITVPIGVAVYPDTVNNANEVAENADKALYKAAILLTIGTELLYLGDIEFGLHGYAKAVPMILGPFLYAGGQLIISLSPSFGKQSPEKNAVNDEVRSVRTIKASNSSYINIHACAR